MLEHSIYTVVFHRRHQPQFYGETLEKRAKQQNSMKITAQDLIEMKIIDDVIQEPVGGAHRNHEKILEMLRQLFLNIYQRLLS